MLQADASKPVLVAGDPERQHIGKVEKEDGITYHINQINDSVSIWTNLFCSFPLIWTFLPFNIKCGYWA